MLYGIALFLVEIRISLSSCVALSCAVFTHGRLFNRRWADILLKIFFGEGRKPGALMNPRVIPTCFAFWPGEKELNLHIKHHTLEPIFNA